LISSSPKTAFALPPKNSKNELNVYKLRPKIIPAAEKSEFDRTA
jgi:hypothetical protein